VPSADRRRESLSAHAKSLLTFTIRIHAQTSVEPMTDVDVWTLLSIAKQSEHRVVKER
jgi:hypothetical protein